MESILSGPVASPRHRFDDSERHQAEPEINDHAEIELEWRMVRSHRQVLFQQKVSSIPPKHSDEGMHKVSC